MRDGRSHPRFLPHRADALSEIDGADLGPRLSRSIHSATKPEFTVNEGAVQIADQKTPRRS
jgi:hypothetical protein